MWGIFYIKRKKVHPIIFNTEMVKAIFDGKTHTRRIGNRYKNWMVGDRIWIKETHYLFGRWLKNGFTKLRKRKYKFQYDRNVKVFFPDDMPPYVTKNKIKERYGYFKRPSIFMPSWASRINLEIVKIWQERLWNIEDNDCLKEGITLTKNDLRDMRIFRVKPHREIFSELWNSIHKKKNTWEDNPEVTVIEFRRIK